MGLVAGHKPPLWSEFSCSKQRIRGEAGRGWGVNNAHKSHVNIPTLLVSQSCDDLTLGRLCNVHIWVSDGIILLRYFNRFHFPRTSDIKIKRSMMEQLWKFPPIIETCQHNESSSYTLHRPLDTLYIRNLWETSGPLAGYNVLLWIKLKDSLLASSLK